MRGDESRDRGGGLRSPLPPGDSDALAEALIRLTDPEIRAQLGEHGRQAVHDRYDWSRSAVKLLEIYDKPRQGANPVSSAQV